MMQHEEMTDREVREQLDRADAFRESLRSAVVEAAADLDPLDQFDVGGLAHSVGGLNHADKTLRLYHSQCFHLCLQSAKNGFNFQLFQQR